MDELNPGDRITITFKSGEVASFIFIRHFYNMIQVENAVIMKQSIVKCEKNLKISAKSSYLQYFF